MNYSNLSTSRYTVIKPIGEGGAGSVYLAHDNQLQRDVALKRLKEAGGGYDTIMREAQILASLHHPNIVSVYDFGVDDEGAFVVMELVEGKTINTLSSPDNPIPLSFFREVALQALEGLAAAHEKGLIHRDIKPNNIMVQFDGKKVHAKILDFGLAEGEVMPKDNQTDSEGTVMGSVHTIAPEQLVGEPVDVRTDIYSMGCVFYYCLAGRYPHEGSTMDAVIDGHLHGNVQPISTHRPNIPAVLDQVIQLYLSRDASRRPQSADKALEQMRAVTKSPVFHEKDFGLNPQTNMERQMGSSLIHAVSASGIPGLAEAMTPAEKLRLAEEIRIRKTKIFTSGIIGLLLMIATYWCLDNFLIHPAPIDNHLGLPKLVDSKPYANGK